MKDNIKLSNKLKEDFESFTNELSFFVNSEIHTLSNENKVKEAESAANRFKIECDRLLTILTNSWRDGVIFTESLYESSWSNLAKCCESMPSQQLIRNDLLIPLIQEFESHIENLKMWLKENHKTNGSIKELSHSNKSLFKHDGGMALLMYYLMEEGIIDRANIPEGINQYRLLQALTNQIPSGQPNKSRAYSKKFSEIIKGPHNYKQYKDNPSMYLKDLNLVKSVFSKIKSFNVGSRLDKEIKRIELIL